MELNETATSLEPSDSPVDRDFVEVQKTRNLNGQCIVTLLKEDSGRPDMLNPGSISMGSRGPLTLLVIATMLLPMLAGCTGLGGPPEPNARVEADRSTINAGESVNFDARASTSPESTIITAYRWDFGDGSKAETVQGYTSHTFTEAGIYEI